ncbi:MULTISPECIES: cytochrome c biogenesis CcdA family protein [Paraburkholderia]|uniref:cytochrome c biogenesis CcdA family protein n=1 Tax=Paraburkholderia TaxID=1822464 RepID=UPI000373B883|nr:MULTISPECIES: cytochrome c biogenesis CcdA family protein [Paraburkholderia]MDH6149454.1 cytochrome c-type biogenesis protein [Paraburkholderia sp. WSM4179]
MNFGVGAYGLSFAAGALSTLSPCVLPLVPVLIASALSAHRMAVIALALGLGASFSAIGIFLATLGISLGFDGSVFRNVAALLMILFGLVMLSGRLQVIFTRATARFGGAGQRWLSKVRGDTLPGQFAIGLLVGVVWTPCVGPTLGAASTLASQGRNLGDVALLMMVFGFGAGLPLVILGALSRASMTRWRGGLDSAARVGKAVFGAVFVAFGVLALTGLDKVLETAILSASPQWLTAFTTAL